MNTTNTGRVPYTLTDSAITVILPGPTPRTIQTDSVSASEVLAELAKPTHDVERLRTLMTPGVVLADKLDDGDVRVVGNSVLYRGQPVAGALQNAVLRIVRAGLDPTPWKRFIARMERNPSKVARNELILFIECGELAITEDGCFLAYKKVRDNYTDIHSGKFDNSVGQVVSMERRDVDDNRERTCSTGLHFCSKAYLPKFGGWSGNRIVIVKIDPADVVSIPSDYNNTKGRTCRYEVVGEVDPTDNAERHEWNLVYRNDELDASHDFGDPDEWDDDEDDEDDEWYDELDDDDIVVSEVAFVAPGTERRGIWRRLIGR